MESSQGPWAPAGGILGGWGTVAIPGPSSGFWIYIAGPLVGGPVGAGLFECLLRPGLNAVKPVDEGPLSGGT